MSICRSICLLLLGVFLNVGTCLCAVESADQIWGGYPALREGTLTPFWAQEAVGLDFVKAEIAKRQDFQPVGLAIWDVPRLSYGMLPFLKVSGSVIEGERRLREARKKLGIDDAEKEVASHVTMVANIVLSPISGTSSLARLNHYVWTSDAEMGKRIQESRSEEAQDIGSRMQLSYLARKAELLTGSEAVINFSVLLGSLDEDCVFGQGSQDVYSAKLSNFLKALRDGSAPAEIQKFGLFGNKESFDGSRFGIRQNPRLLVFGIGNWSPSWWRRSGSRIKGWFSAPKSNLHLRDYGLIVGSLSPEGEISDFSFGGAAAPDIVAPVDRELMTIYMHQPEVPRFAGYTSAAAPFISGIEADIVGIIGRVSLEEVKIILNRTALKSIDGAKMVNAYRQMRVAQRLRAKEFSARPREDRMKILEDDSLYDFASEAEEIWSQLNKFDSRDQKGILKMARRAYFLNPTAAKAHKISELYADLGFTVNAQFYLRFADALSRDIGR